ncbi:hypothetical protein CsatA_023013 [Cannabis sativa]
MTIFLPRSFENVEALLCSEISKDRTRRKDDFSLFIIDREGFLPINKVRSTLGGGL